MNKSFLRLGNALAAGRSLVWGNPLAAGVVFAIVVSLLVLLSLLLRDVNPAALPAADSRSTDVSALQSDPSTTTPTATPTPAALAAQADIATVSPYGHRPLRCDRSGHRQPNTDIDRCGDPITNSDADCLANADCDGTLCPDQCLPIGNRNWRA